MLALDPELEFPGGVAGVGPELKHRDDDDLRADDGVRGREQHRRAGGEEKTETQGRVERSHEREH
jgi:hypothetical protein